MKWYSYLLVLVILMFVAMFVFKQKEKTGIGFSEHDKYKPEKIIINKTLDESDYIYLAKEKLEALLIKQDKKWFVQMDKERLLPCDEIKVKKIFEELESIKVDMVVSNNPKKFVKFTVDDTSTFKLVIKKGDKEILNFYVGKNNMSFTGTYVRHKNENITLLTNKRLSSTVINATENFWLNKEIVGEVKFDNVLNINLQYSEDEKKMRTIERDGETDTFYLTYSDTKFLAKKNEIQKIVNNLNKLKAENFVDTGFKEDKEFAKTNYVCEINFKDGNKYKLIVGLKTADGKNYYVKNVDKKYFYLLNVSKIKNIFVEDSKVVQIEEKKKDKQEKPTDDIPVGVKAPEAVEEKK